MIVNMMMIAQKVLRNGPIGALIKNVGPTSQEWKSRSLLRKKMVNVAFLKYLNDRMSSKPKRVHLGRVKKNKLLHYQKIYVIYLLLEHSIDFI